MPRELARMLAAGAIDPVTHAADLALYRDVKATAKRLSGTPRVQLAGTVAAVDGHRRARRADRRRASRRCA